MFVKGKVIKEKDGYVFEGRESIRGLYLFINKFGDVEGYQNVKFVRNSGQVEFGSKDSKSSILSTSLSGK